MKELFEFLTTTFNNREIAVGTWLFGVILYTLSLSPVRKSFGGVIKAILVPKLVLFFGTVAINTALICLVLMHFSLWTTDQLPASLLWLVLSGCAMAGAALQAKEDEGYFRGLALGSLSASGVFEFIVVAKSFSLMAELILVPICFIMGAVYFMSENDKENATAHKLVTWILIIIAAAFAWHSLMGILENLDGFFSSTTGRNFLLPIFLTIGSIPLFYLWYCYSHIEGARIQIDMKTFQSDELKRYARKKFFLTFAARPWLLRRATRQFQSLPAETNTDVDQIIKEILKNLRETRNPPAVDEALGWSPYLAREFLADHGLRTNDYHRGYDGQYWASSEYVDLDEHILPNKAVFYVEGQEDHATTLKLTAKFLDQFDKEAGLIAFRNISQTLIEKAKISDEVDVVELLPTTDVFETCVVVGGTEVKSWGERYPNERGAELFLTLSR